MIFKKPYAFLIKNFKTIHIILSGIIVFIIGKYRDVSGFFRDYVNGGIRTSIGLADTYISDLLYLAIVLVIIFAFVMFLLMYNKKKPTLFYILLFIYYILLLIATIIASAVMSSLENASLTQQVARSYRDIYFILAFPQYYFIVQSIIRGIGFDVKKFNFNKDLVELEIKSEDNEEFEFILGTDTYKYERKVRRTLREIKYYILENKFMFTILGGIIGIIIMIYLFMNFNLINKVYKMDQSGNIGSFYYKLNAAYITQYDYNGKLINQDKKYVIVNLTVKNLTSNPKLLDNTVIYLNYGNSNAYYQPSVRNYFVDMGKSYINEYLAPNVARDLIFIFEVGSNTNYQNFKIKFLKEIIYDKDNHQEYIYADFKISPKVINQGATLVERNMNEVMYLGDTLYKDSNAIFNKIEILTKYEYQYELCKNDECKTYYDVIAPANPINNKLLIIDYKLQINENIPFNESMNADKYFFDRFLKIEYIYNDKKIIKNLSGRTYPGLPNKLFVDIPNAYISKKLLNIIVNTRDYQYYIDYNNIK